MPDVRLPGRARKAKGESSRSRPAQRAWIGRHHCCVPRCVKLPIECAHVHRHTDGGMALKPSDRWLISLCSAHHLDQHQAGEAEFEKRYGIDMRDLALEFARRSRHWRKLQLA